MICEHREYSIFHASVSDAIPQISELGFSLTRVSLV